MEASPSSQSLCIPQSPQPFPALAGPSPIITPGIFFIAALPVKGFSHFLSLFVTATAAEAALPWPPLSVPGSCCSWNTQGMDLGTSESPRLHPGAAATQPSCFSPPPAPQNSAKALLTSIASPPTPVQGHQHPPILTPVPSRSHPDGSSRTPHPHPHPLLWGCLEEEAPAVIPQLHRAVWPKGNSSNFYRNPFVLSLFWEMKSYHSSSSPQLTFFSPNIRLHSIGNCYKPPDTEVQKTPFAFCLYSSICWSWVLISTGTEELNEIKPNKNRII